MFIGRVIGNVVSTKKDERLVGKKLLIVKPQQLTGHTPEEPVVAVDSVGAGIGETVLCVKGSSAKSVVIENSPVDAAIVGIIDTYEITEG